MATTTIPGIDVGDAVLTVLVDLTQANTALERFGADLPGKLKPSAESVTAFGKAFDDSGKFAQGAAQQAAAFASATTQAGQKAATALQQTKAQADSLRVALAQTGTSAKAGIDPGTEAVEQLKLRITDLEAEIAKLELEVKGVGPAFQEAGEQAAFSMREAKGEVALLGEATGVKLPRHVRGFLAELPGVGAALNAAFSATAVFFLIDALIQGAEKLTEFIATTFIFTESMKKADEIFIKNNADVKQHADQVKKLKDEFLLLGLDGVQKTGEEMQLLTRDIAANNAALIAAEENAGKLNARFGDSKDHAAELAQANAEVATLAASRAELEQRRTNLAKQGAIERTAEARKEALAQIEIDKSRADSIALLKANENKQLVADANATSEHLTEIDAKYQVDLYNNELVALARKLALDKTDRTKDPGLVQEDNQKIEALQRDHASALIKIYADTIAGINALSLGTTGRRDLGSTLLGTDFQDKFQQAEDAAAQLGIQLSGSFAESATKAKEALDNLKDSGVATAHDLLLAETQLTVAQVNSMRANGESTKAIRDLIHAQEDQVSSAISVAQASGKDATEMQRVMVVLQQLDGRVVRGKQTWDTFFKDLISGSLRTGQAIKELGTLTAEGIGKSVTAAVTGSQSFGEAMAQMAKAAFAALAGLAVAKAVEEVARAASDFALAASFAADPFTAYLAPPIAAAGAHHLAVAALWGALGAGTAGIGSAIPGGSSSSSGGSSGGGSSSGAGSGQVSPTQTTQQPVQVVNTQHLARGGLITQRTLAVIGDAAVGPGSQREAVIPVDDNRFMDALAGNLAERLGNSGGVVNNHYWTIQGVISGDNLQKVAKQISDRVNKGNVRLKSSNTLRITKRG